jgi:Nucleoside 2-deoxyribosyltransferase like
MYVEAPQPYDGSGPSVFLAGGITGCPDWQAVAAAKLLPHTDVLNPRRREYHMSEAEYARQVTWEYHHLRRADVVLFWFPTDALQAIALFELGAFAVSDKPIVVGADPGYPRRTDVVLQLSHARPGLVIHSTLESTLESTIEALTRAAES